MSATRTTSARARRAPWRTLLATSLVAILTGGGLNVAAAKDLDEYATWDDVIAAQGDVDRQNQLIDEITLQIDQLNDDVAIAEQNARDAGEIYTDAADAATRQDEQHYTLSLQADEAAGRADDAERDAGAMAAAMADRASTDPTLQLLMQPDGADDFLMSMSTLSKLGTNNGAIYDDAIAERNNADQLADQAQDALDELNRLQDIAKGAYDDARTAQDDVQAARDAAIDQGSELEAMLIPLKEHRDVVEADYQEGERLREEERIRLEEERRREEEERQRKAEEEAAAAAAAAAAAEEEARQAAEEAGVEYVPPAPEPEPAPDSGGGDGGAPAPSWGLSYPMDPGSWITSYYGYRVHPVYDTWRYHAGIDLVTYGTCWSPLYAVGSGTVSYAGWLGTYGNLVDIESGGTTFRYAHIVEGGINVYPGQWVNAGDVIGYVGTTGASTGCHLHFEVMEWGNNVDPQTWLSDRGMYYW